eukprot:NODE_60_length_25605_cov_0.732377.p4 type:complete len:599 gc:universal NODE_60_length_25605_cov_0.732377:19333-17537(-)
MPQQIRRRERWKSRFSYIVASASAIIGIGNFLRFPGIASKYEGITFLIPYLILSWLVGYTMVTLEISCGEMYRTGIITFFDKIKKSFRGFGMLSMFAALICMSYLNVILGWLLIYMIRSSYTPWEANPNEYFQIYILNQDVFNVEVCIITILCCLFIWTVLFISIYKGVTHTTQIVYLTYPLAMLMMTMLLLRSVTLPNAMNVLLNTVSIIEFRMLFRARLWLDALGQVLFSLSIGIGSSSAYGSYKIKDGKLMKDTFIIVFINITIELIGWIIVICIADHENWTRLDITNNKFHLAFILYPQLFQRLPFPSTWSFLYYIFMLTFGINCAHATLESIVTTLLDSKRYSKYSRIKVTSYVLIFGSLLSIVFCMFSSLIEPVDYYNSSLFLMFVALGEIIAATYYYNKQMVSDQLSSVSVDIAYTSWVLAPIIGSFIYHVTGSYYLRAFMAIAVFMTGTICAVVIAPKEISLKKKFYLLFKYQGDIFIQHFNDTLQMSDNRVFRLNILWFNCLKYISAPFVISLLSEGFFKIVASEMNYFIIGIMEATIGIGIILSPFYLPSFFNSFVPEDAAEEENRLHLDEWLRYWCLKEGKLLHKNQ